MRGTLPVTWSDTREEVASMAVAFLDLIESVISKLEDLPTVASAEIYIDDYSDEGESAVLVFRIWSRLRGEEAFRLENEIDDVIEGLERDLGLPAGRAMALVHWASHGA